MNNPKCFHNHMGVWAARPETLDAALHAIGNGLIVASTPAKPHDSPIDGVAVFSHPNMNVAVVAIDDVMMKHRSKFGGCSTVEVRRQLAAIRHDPRFQNGRGAVLLSIDSPGGHLEGMQDLLTSIQNTDKSVPVYAYISDMGCSAAYWAASAARHICISRMGATGSIGTFTVLYDVTGAMEADGVRAVRVASGDRKGLGADGAVTDELIAEVKREIEVYTDFFFGDVRAARPAWDGVSATDGGVVFAEEALKIGLVDSISTFDEFITRIVTGENVNKAEKEVVDVQDEIVETPDPVTEPEDVLEEEEVLHRLGRVDARKTANAAAAETLKRLVAATGVQIEVDEDDPEKTLELLAAHIKTANARPTKTSSAKGKPSGASAAKVTLAEYRAKFGTILGGAKFRQDRPEMAKQLEVEAEDGRRRHAIAAAKMKSY